jgi:alkaline phosphatase D
MPQVKTPLPSPLHTHLRTLPLALALTLPLTLPLTLALSLRPALSEPLESGPMVGFGSAHETLIWARLSPDALARDAQIQVKYWPTAHRAQAKTSAALKLTGRDGRTLRHVLSDLEPNTTYEYTLTLNGEELARPYAQRFKTLPRWHRRTPPPDLVATFGSCAYLNQYPTDDYGGGEAIFESIRAQSPDLMLWLGDAVYLNPQDAESAEGIARRYASYRAHPALQPLLASTHHYATWDDHDYGPNDANWSYPLKGDALATFKEYWGNAAFGLPELPGVFGAFSWGDVDFFLLDNRTYRTSGKAPPNESRYLGDAQLQWLLDALSVSRASFKVIASGSQVLSPYAYFESYAQHPRELARLLEGLKAREVEGVIFLSGDRHHAELNVLRDDPHFYPLYDFTSSPLTSGLADSAEAERMNPRRVPNTFVTHARNFGVMRVSGPRQDRVMTLEARDTQGALLWSHTVRARELRLPTQSAP